MRPALLLAGGLLFSGCAHMVKERGHQELAAMVEARTGFKTRWEKGPPEESEVAKWVEALLRGGLTRERAIEIALVNNRQLQATYEELGVSQADMVQAGLLKNPTLGVSAGFPLGRGGGLVEYDYSLVQDFLDLFILPTRKRIAEEQFQADTLRVTQEALNTVAQVSKELAEYQASLQLLELRKQVLVAFEAAADLAERQYRAGNINALESANEQAAYQQARLDLASAELELVEHRERLNRLLGLWGTATAWKMAETLPELPKEELPLEHLEALAIQQRYDIDAARKQVALLGRGLSLARGSALFGRVEVGVEGHRDPDGPRVLGPVLSLELPIFDQRQALIGRLEALVRQSERRLAGMSVDARSEVRVARAQLLLARQTVQHYQQTLLPLREQVLGLSQLQYNAMQIGLFQLLVAKQSQVEGMRAYLEALKTYWVARAELERVAGGRIGPLRKAKNDSKAEAHENEQPAK